MIENNEVENNEVEASTADNEVVKTEVVDKKDNKKQKKPKSKTRKIIEWVLLGIFLLFAGFVGAGQIDSMIHKNENYGQSLRFGVGSFIVLTNSMEPLYKKDSALITYKENFDEVYARYQSVKSTGGYVDITFANIETGIFISDSEFENQEFSSIHGGQKITTNQVMTHRIREIHVDNTKKYGEGKYIIVTAGINTGGVSSLEGQYQISTEKQYLGTVKINSPFLGAIFGFISSIWGLLILLLIPAGILIFTSAKDIFKTLKENEAPSEGEVQKVDALENISDKDRERLKQELLDEMIQKKMEDKANENKD